MLSSHYLVHPEVQQSLEERRGVTLSVQLGVIGHLDRGNEMETLCGVDLGVRRHSKAVRIT